MNVKVVQFQYGPKFLGLTYSQFVQTFQDIIWRILVTDYKIFIPSRIELLNIVVAMSDRESIRIIKNGIMGTSDSKEVVNHVSDLSYSKKPILFLSFLCSSR